MTTNTVSIVLNKEQALVLFEFLSNIDKKFDRGELLSSEQRVLWDIEAMLEAKLTEPFEDNYLNILNEAHAKIDGS